MTAAGAAARALRLVAAALTASASHGAAAPPPLASWTPTVRIPGVVDLAGPRLDGRFVVTASGRLWLLTGTTRQPFARGPGGYAGPRHGEPYLAMTPDQPVDGADCAFHQDEVYALDPSAHPGVVLIDPDGQARRAVSLPVGDVPTGIAFDTVGRFGYRLLVTARGPHGTVVLTVDCDGVARALTTTGPRVEGGMSVAPATFGPYGGDLVAADETSGRVVAFAPDGRATTITDSGLPAGGDLGVESTGFVPPDFGPTSTAYLADLGVPGNRHPGTDHVLTLTGAALLGAGVRPGDLLVATEGGAATIDVSCAPVGLGPAAGTGAACETRRVATGPTVTHAEGHILFSS